MSTWEQEQSKLDAGPQSAIRSGMKWLLVLAVCLMGLGLVISIAGSIFGWFGNAVQVANQQFSPQAMLAKYEWFKDAAAGLDRLDANVRVYDSRRKSLESTYSGIPRAQWPRDDRQEWDQIAAEVSGTKAAYNDLAAQYNAQMAKFNYRFANAGELPQGADRALPREYRTYSVE